MVGGHHHMPEGGRPEDSALVQSVDHCPPQDPLGHCLRGRQTALEELAAGTHAVRADLRNGHDGGDDAMEELVRERC